MAKESQLAEALEKRKKKKFRDAEGKEWDLDQFDERRYWTKEKRKKK